MPFNDELASELAGAEDRDDAPFFAGRRAEIAAFDNALTQAAKRTGAVFRVYQGAPGCGKTSLVNHLRKHKTSETLFVATRPRHLTSMGVLHATIADAVRRDKGLAWRLARAGARTGVQLLKAQPLGNVIGEAVGSAQARQATVVLH